MLFQTSIEM